MEPTGTIVFASVGRLYYGFDIFSVSALENPSSLTENRLTDGVSINFNGQFAGEDGTGLVYISERTGSARIYLNRAGNSSPEQLHSPPESLFHDRPAMRNGRLYFISAHEPPDKPFSSWSALYSTKLDVEDKKSPASVQRLTPYGCVDYSPSISRSGKLIAVASYGLAVGVANSINSKLILSFSPNPTHQSVWYCVRMVAGRLGAVTLLCISTAKLMMGGGAFSKLIYPTILSHPATFLPLLGSRHRESTALRLQLCTRTLAGSLLPPGERARAIAEMNIIP